MKGEWAAAEVARLVEKREEGHWLAVVPGQGRHTGALETSCTTCVAVSISRCDGSDKTRSSRTFEIRSLLDVMAAFMMEKSEEYMSSKGRLGRGWIMVFILYFAATGRYLVAKEHVD